jgi:hypothetical protein
MEKVKNQKGLARRPQKNQSRVSLREGETSELGRSILYFVVVVVWKNGASRHDQGWADEKAALR